MGGHGGLNILPQKRWNVYNRDNRAKVEKDRRELQEKNEVNEKNLNENIASSRYEDLKRRKFQKSLPPQSSEINKELEEMTKSKHMNLFEDAENINNIEANRLAKIEKDQKQSNFDESSKFLGALDEKLNKPWYINTQEKQPKDKKQEIYQKEKDYYKLMKDFQVDSSNFFKVMDHSFFQKNIKAAKEAYEKEINNEKKEKHKKKHKKHKKKDKKHKKSRSRSRSRSFSKEKKEDKTEKIQKLREERLKREALEKKKVISLLNKTYDL